MVILQKLKQSLKKAITAQCCRFVNLNFRPTPAIIRQKMDFSFRESLLTVETDFRTPLYETINEIVDYDCYQLSRCHFSSDSDGIILDVGGNVGVAALVLSRLHKGKVITIEPIEENCVVLKRNLAINSVSNVEVLQAAITEHDGSADLWMDPTQSISAKVRPADAGPSSLAHSTARSLSLRSLLQLYPGRPIELLKMDCEGGEYCIIDQIDEQLAPSIPQITMEVHDLDSRHSLKTIQAKLGSLGYRLFYKPELMGRSNLHHLLAIR